MKVIGSQVRELIGSTTMKVVGVTKYNEVILEDEESGDLEIWAPNDHFAGYVIEIAGVGYEFVTSICRAALGMYRKGEN